MLRKRKIDCLFVCDNLVGQVFVSFSSRSINPETALTSVVKQTRQTDQEHMNCWTLLTLDQTTLVSSFLCLSLLDAFITAGILTCHQSRFINNIKYDCIAFSFASYRVSVPYMLAHWQSVTDNTSGFPVLKRQHVCCACKHILTTGYLLHFKTQCSVVPLDDKGVDAAI